MKRHLLISLSALLAVMLVFGSAVMPARAEPATAAQTTTTGGWLTDLDGNLVTDRDGYYVVYIMPNMVTANTVSLNLNPFAALFLKSFKNVSDSDATYKLRIVNNSGKILRYVDYAFTTENLLPRTAKVFRPLSGSLTDVPALDRTFGSAFTAMLPTITEPDTYTDRCLDVKCFDGKNINMMIAPLRCVNDALLDFYGAAETYEITLPQLMNRDQNLRAAGYTGYADYLRQYYGVSSLYDLTAETAYNVLGTTRNAQTGITCWRDNTAAGKPIPAAEVNLLTEEFKIWGLMETGSSAAYPYGPKYFMLETDPEVIEFAYDFLYSQGLRFTFDSVRQPFDLTDSETGRGGDFAIKAYMNKTPGANAHVNAVFGGEVLDQGQYIALDHVTGGYYAPNAWNQYRMVDYGFSLLFSACDIPVTTTQPGETTTQKPTEPHGELPDTGDNMPIFLVSLAAVGLAVLLAVQVILYYSRKKK